MATMKELNEKMKQARREGTRQKIAASLGEKPDFTKQRADMNDLKQRMKALKRDATKQNIAASGGGATSKIQPVTPTTVAHTPKVTPLPTVTQEPKKYVPTTKTAPNATAAAKRPWQSYVKGVGKLPDEQRQLYQRKVNKTQMPSKKKV